MAEPTVCLFTTIRAPLAETLAFANYHLNTAFDHIYMFFDDPDDPAMDVLGSEKRVTCIRCDAGYWANLFGNLPKSGLSINVKQEINARVAIKKSRENSYTWICHLDGDELIYAAEGFKKAIATLKPNVQIARFPVLEVIPERIIIQSAFEELCFFKHAPINHIRRNKSVYMNPREIILFYMDKVLYNTKKIRTILLGCNCVTDDYIKGHTAGKSITRTNAPIVSYTSHLPILSGQMHLPIILLRDVNVLHYDVPDYDHWKKKWYTRYINIQNGIIPVQMSDHRSRQFEQFIKVYERGNEEDLIKLYENDFFISDSDRIILQKTGLVSEIHLPAELFAPASDHYLSESTHT